MKAPFIPACRSLALAFVCILMGACTQNDGHIGKIFGSWSLSLMTIDGEERQLGDGEFSTMSFQGDIVMFVLADQLHNSVKSYGTWRMTDNILSLDFNHSSDGFPTGTGVFAPPAWLYMPDGVSDYQITKFTSDRLELLRVAEDGRIYIYKFKKTW